MKLYNTLTRKLEDFEPQHKNLVKLYTCGPTVYNYAQIGNLRAFIFDDTLRRALTIAGYDVQHVMNITDVGHLVSDEDEGEDKLEKGAAREGKTVWEVAEYYTEAFRKDVAALNILQPNAYQGRPDGYARATDFIQDQIKLVQRLFDKGFVYQTTQAIYFDITKLADYGKLTGQKLGDKEVAARKEVVTDPDKRHPFDFAVWFFTTGHFANHSMHWESPWGDGFPGWHLECSAIIHALLEDPIDIHTGGVDHIGTHHTNEMAQTQAAYGHELSRFWLHNEFILVDGAKMSKSKGNFYTLKDLSDKGYDPLAYRLMVLQAHYRNQLNFTWESLQGAQNRLKDLQAMADLQHQADDNASSLGNDFFHTAMDRITAALADDLNTPEALKVLSEISSHIDTYGKGLSIVNGDDFRTFLSFLDEAFGLNLRERPDISTAQRKLLMERHEAREAKDWTTSDKLRDQLEKQGIGVKDTPGGWLWYRL